MLIHLPKRHPTLRDFCSSNLLKSHYKVNSQAAFKIHSTFSSYLIPSSKWLIINFSFLFYSMCAHTNISSIYNSHKWRTKGHKKKKQLSCMWSMAITENYDKNQSYWRLMDHFICFFRIFLFFGCWKHLNACIVSQMDISSCLWR